MQNTIAAFNEVNKAEKHLEALKHRRPYVIINGERVTYSYEIERRLFDEGVESIEVFNYVSEGELTAAENAVREARERYNELASTVIVYKNGKLADVYDSRKPREENADESECYYGSDRYFEDGYEAGYICY